MLELELEQWREALEKRGMKMSRAKTEYICLNITPLGSVHMQSASCHRSPNLNIWEAPCRAMVAWMQIQTRGHSVYGTSVRNEHIMERLKVESIAERCRKARLRWCGHLTKTTQEEILWIWYHPGEESDEDRSRDGWTVSTDT